ncbi:MAG: peptidoglycan editing factor PgeF [Georgfuchsia sp.]
MSEIIIPDWPAPENVRALVTTRNGGASVGPFTSFNLADHVEDDPQAVATNRRLLRQHVPELPADPLWLKQVHGIDCVSAENCTVGMEADASWSRTKGKVCAVLTADCLPLLLCDEAGSVVSAVHAGWQGLAKGVIEAAVKTLPVPPQTLLAWMGPAIGPNAFEVGAEVRDQFFLHDPEASKAFRSIRNGKWLCDIYLLARQRLNVLGVTRIYGGGECTVTDAARFFSFRRDRVTGRMASLIWLGS